MFILSSMMMIIRERQPLRETANRRDRQRKRYWLTLSKYRWKQYIYNIQLCNLPMWTLCAIDIVSWGIFCKQISFIYIKNCYKTNQYYFKNTCLRSYLRSYFNLIKNESFIIRNLTVLVMISFLQKVDVILKELL